MNETDENAGPTRRDYLKYGGALLSGGLLAGCAGQSGDTTSTTTATETATETETETDTAETTTATPESSYEAELSPVGTVTLDEPPTNVFTHFPWFPDMASALGQGDTVNNLWWDGTVAGLEYFTAGFDDFDIEWADAAGEYGFTKERLYELDSDLHLVDPAWVSTQDNWNQADIDEVADNIGPWFGNYYSNFNAAPPEEWADGYEHYDLWELFDRVASLYGERERYEALQSVRDEQLTTVEDGLPGDSERPTAAYLSLSTDLSSIYLLRLNAPGYWNAHTRPLGAVDAFGDEEFTGPFQEVDMEALLEADPDVILSLWTVTETVDFDGLKQNLRDDPVGRELAAVQNDRVYPQGTRWQGPLMNLFQTEMTAKQLYPDQFGDWPTYQDGDDYPDFGADEQLFDHGRVEEIVAGENL
ncbi:putative iron-III ABC transporter periplasmic substrate-binding protein [Haloferax prahovense DSM 18310]|uniref:Iron-III ABC transporter periplasmic substrate-binding protein n=1 Tax=Haloferax prahovense (strain DSM 18310 / JCM 13924 / TL6) TaxID=1227461 RepID=M0G235_HALPT|nr:ABC transporter substrate-binding protein [Haloferax prahovense]ELZ65628.1 putative iron-III ABC transporter periplasmic substrate-binding protein [Haloferax prahovense DSM 18310]